MDSGRGAYARVPFDGCPLCATAGVKVLRLGNCAKHPYYSEGFDPRIAWQECTACGHVFTSGYWSDSAAAILFDRTLPQHQVGFELEKKRPIAGRMIEFVSRHVSTGTWLDVGFGNGALLLTAEEWGYKTVGLDMRRANVVAMQQLGIEAHRATLADFAPASDFDVISLADVLEHIPFPLPALAAAHRLLATSGALFLSVPAYNCAAWRLLDRKNANPYWNEIEHYHNFTRSRLHALLAEVGFVPAGYRIGERYRLGMEIVARKA